MRIDIREIEKEVMKEHKNYQRYIIILIALSVVVAAIVVASLIKPAVTMTYTCGFEEHIHTESCYKLTCDETVDYDDETGETKEHIHSLEKGCYDTSAPLCGMEQHIHRIECEDTPEDEESASDVLTAEEVKELDDYNNVPFTEDAAETTMANDTEKMTEISENNGEIEVSKPDTEMFDDKIGLTNFSYEDNKLKYTISIPVSFKDKILTENPEIILSDIEDEIDNDSTEISDTIDAENIDFNEHDMALAIIAPGEYISDTVVDKNADGALHKHEFDWIHENGTVLPVSVYPLESWDDTNVYEINCISNIDLSMVNAETINLQPVVKLYYYANTDDENEKPELQVITAKADENTWTASTTMTATETDGEEVILEEGTMTGQLTEDIMVADGEYSTDVEIKSCTFKNMPEESCAVPLEIEIKNNNKKKSTGGLTVEIIPPDYFDYSAYLTDVTEDGKTKLSTPDDGKCKGYYRTSDKHIVYSLKLDADETYTITGEADISLKDLPADRFTQSMDKIKVESDDVEVRLYCTGKEGYVTERPEQQEYTTSLYFRGSYNINVNSKKINYDIKIINHRHFDLDGLEIYIEAFDRMAKVVNTDGENTTSYDDYSAYRWEGSYGKGKKKYQISEGSEGNFIRSGNIVTFKEGNKSYEYEFKINSSYKTRVGVWNTHCTMSNDNIVFLDYELYKNYTYDNTKTPDHLLEHATVQNNAIVNFDNMLPRPYMDTEGILGTMDGNGYYSADFSFDFGFVNLYDDTSWNSVDYNQKYFICELNNGSDGIENSEIISADVSFWCKGEEDSPVKTMTADEYQNYYYNGEKIASCYFENQYKIKITFDKCMIGNSPIKEIKVTLHTKAKPNASGGLAKLIATPWVGDAFDYLFNPAEDTSISEPVNVPDGEEKAVTLILAVPKLNKPDMTLKAVTYGTHKFMTAGGEPMNAGLMETTFSVDFKGVLNYTEIRFRLRGNNNLYKITDQQLKDLEISGTEWNVDESGNKIESSGQHFDKMDESHYEISKSEYWKPLDRSIYCYKESGEYEEDDPCYEYDSQIITIKFKAGTDTDDSNYTTMKWQHMEITFRSIYNVSDDRTSNFFVWGLVSSCGHNSDEGFAETFGGRVTLIRVWDGNDTISDSPYQYYTGGKGVNGKYGVAWNSSAPSRAAETEYDWKENFPYSNYNEPIWIIQGNAIPNNLGFSFAEDAEIRVTLSEGITYKDAKLYTMNNHNNGVPDDDWELYKISGGGYANLTEINDVLSISRPEDNKLIFQIPKESSIIQNQTPFLIIIQTEVAKSGLYSLTANPVYWGNEITGDQNFTQTQFLNSHEMLPATGGRGTRIYIITGFVLMMLPMAFLLKKTLRRRNPGKKLIIK